MYTLYFPSLGEITLDLDTIFLCGHIFHIIGYDDSHSRIKFTMDKLSCLEEYYYDYGYCHIISYTKDGVTVPCSFYHALG